MCLLGCLSASETATPVARAANVLPMHPETTAAQGPRDHIDAHGAQGCSKHPTRPGYREQGDAPNDKQGAKHAIPDSRHE